MGKDTFEVFRERLESTIHEQSEFLSKMIKRTTTPGYWGEHDPFRNEDLQMLLNMQMLINENIAQLITIVESKLPREE